MNDRDSCVGVSGRVSVLGWTWGLDEVRELVSFLRTVGRDVQIVPAPTRWELGTWKVVIQGNLARVSLIGD
jgi:hypothetical protein